MPVLVVAAVVLGTWYLSRRWQDSKGPAAAEKVVGVLRLVWKGVLAALAVAVVAAMAQGCDGEDGPSGGGDPTGEPCRAYRAEDCAPGGSGTTTTLAGLGLGDDTDEPRYAPCPAFHEEDCPPAPPSP